MSRKDFRDATFSVVLDIMRADKDVVLLTNDMQAFEFAKIREACPGRLINVGVAEQNMMLLAAGLASAGKRVFVYGMIAHLMRGWEQIKIGICLPNLPVTILGLGAGLSMGLDGPTHHGTEDVALMRVLSNMTIYNPADWVCTEAVVRMAYEARTPHYIRLDKEQLPALYKEGHDFSGGYAVFGDPQQNVTVATGIQTWRARAIPGCVVDIFRLKPSPNIASDLINLKDRAAIAIWDEHHPSGGLFSIVAEMLCTAERTTLPDKFLMGETKRAPVTGMLAYADDGYGMPYYG